MKLDPNKAFPFPVLRSGGNNPDSDYPGHEFQANAEVSTPDADHIAIEIDFTLRQREIMTLIEQGDARYGCLVVCTRTLYREMLTSTEPSLKRTFQLGTLDDIVELRPCVIAVNDIKAYASPDLNEEFGNVGFDIVAGSPLAQDVTLAFPANQEYLKPITSIFEIAQDREQMSGQFDVRFDERIQIIVSPEDARWLTSARRAIQHRASIMTSFYLPVVITVLAHMVNSNDDVDEHAYEPWRRVFQYKIDQLGSEMSLDGVVDGRTTLLAIAQSLLKNPVRHLEYMKESE